MLLLFERTNKQHTSTGKFKEAEIMATIISSRVVSILYFLLIWSIESPVPTMAWGTIRPEFCSHHHRVQHVHLVGGYGMMATTRHQLSLFLRASEEYDNDDLEEADVQNEQRASSSSSLEDFYQNIGNDIIASENFRRTMNRFDSVWEPADLDDTEWLDCGEECDEVCAIPEHYKSEKSESPSIDVMAFLGIRRAVPLHIDQDWQ